MRTLHASLLKQWRKFEAKRGQLNRDISKRIRSGALTTAVNHFFYLAPFIHDNRAIIIIFLYVLDFIYHESIYRPVYASARCKRMLSSIHFCDWKTWFIEEWFNHFCTFLSYCLIYDFDRSSTLQWSVIFEISKVNMTLNELKYN